MLSALFASGRAADLVLLAMAVEAILLASVWRVRAAAVIVPMLPGVLLVLALKAALTGIGWHWIALPLALSWPCHLLDQRQRLRHAVRRRRSQGDTDVRH